LQTLTEVKEKSSSIDEIRSQVMLELL